MGIPVLKRAAAACVAALTALTLAAAPVAAQPHGNEPPKDPAHVESNFSKDRVAVLVTLKNQPGSPSKDGESRNLREQIRLINSWSKTYGIEVDRQFGFLVNGFSATMPAANMAKLQAEPAVDSVRRERQYERTEYEAREMEQVSAAFEDYGVDGSGMVVAVIDSGVDPTHEDMRIDDGVDTKIDTVNPNGKFTKKIPEGYNYADENYEFWDTTTSQHGMHVAGIVAANAPDGKKSGLEGVAPNAQILSLKVFSNGANPYASDSDLIAAIEDAVKLKADVINLSLGSTNGVKWDSDGSNLALKKAEEMGVLAVISSGNDGLNFSETGGTDDALGKFDDGTVGTPGIQGNALTVASVDNNVVSTPRGFYNDGEDHPFGYQLQIGEATNKPYEVAFLGRGKKEDYPDGTDLSGKIALIERGEISFTEKFQRAIDHGAAGVLVFNSQEGGEAFAGMAGIEDFTIIGGSLKRSTGVAIRDAIEKAGDKPVTVRLTKEIGSETNPTAAQASQFSSWGTTPNLEFEPEIAGIGGSVYSTLNDNKYGTKSGTSMAAPNISGMSALLLENYAERYPELSGPERLARARTALMNTAIPVKNGEHVAPPRQVGAGLAQMHNALDTNVYATVDGEPAVELKEVNSVREFTVTLTNHSGEAVTYDVPAQTVLNETNAKGEKTTSVVSHESLQASEKSVTVPANGTANVTFTLKPDLSAGDHFIEGYAVLHSENAPTLSVPYFGFVGDWNAEPIVAEQGHGWDALGVKSEVTGLSTTLDLFGSPYPSTLPEGGWLSPNGDGTRDEASAALAMMRNAADVEFNVLTEDGEPLVDLGATHSVPRTIAGDVLEVKNKLAPEGSTLINGGTFDGRMWDPAKGEFVNVPEGRYIYRVKSRLSEDFDWQTVDMPFGIDVTPPEVSVGELENGTITITIDDKLSGANPSLSVIDATGEGLPVKANGDGTYTVTVKDAQASKYLWFIASDNAYNKVEFRKVLVDDDPLVLLNTKTYNDPEFVFGNASDAYVDGKFQLSGTVTSQVAKVEVEGKSYDITGGGFTALVDVKPDAENSITAKAFNKAGEEIDSETLTFYYDAQPASVDISASNLDEDGRIIPNEDGSITIKGTIKDPEPSNPVAKKGGLWAGVNWDFVGAEPDGSFEVTTSSVEEGEPFFVLQAGDNANFTYLVVEISGRVKGSKATPTPEFENLECLQGFALCLVSPESGDLSEDGSTYTLRGNGGQPGSTVTLTPGARAEGEHMGSLEPITATVGEDGTFTAKVPIATGENHYEYVVTNPEGEVKSRQILNIWFDVNAPTVRFDSPNLVNGTLFTNKDDVTFAGSAEDDGWGYSLRVNNQQAVDIHVPNAIGPEANRREFSETVAVADGDTILVSFADSVGNTRVAAIPVIVDKVAPEVSIETVADGERIIDGRTLTVSATDPHLASLNARFAGVTADGTLSREFVNESVTLDTEKVTVENVLVDVDEIDPGKDSASQAESVDGGEAPAHEAATSSSSEDVTAEGTLAVPDTTSLSGELDTSSLPAGRYTVTAASADLAGNEQTGARTFDVDAEPVIEGEDALSLTVNRKDLADDEALAERVLEAYSVSDDGAVLADGTVAKGETTTLALREGTVLTAGENSVVLVATDAAGRQVVRSVKVTIDLEQVTLRAGDLSATSTFRSDDSLTADIASDNGVHTIAVSNAFGPLEATFTLPVPEGSAVMLVREDGTEEPIGSTWADGMLTWVGSSQGTYRVVEPARTDGGDDGKEIVAPAKPGPKGSSGDSGGRGDASANPEKPGGSPSATSGSSGSGEGEGPTVAGSQRGKNPSRGKAKGASAFMPRTGAEVAGLMLVGGALVAAGAMLMTTRRRDQRP